MASIQASAIAIDGRAILLIGPPRCGKSDLALRMIGRGAALIGDDGIDLEVIGQRLMALPMAGRSQRLHVAEIGVVAVPLAASSPAALAVMLDPDSLAKDRSPTVGRFGPIYDRYLPQVALPAFHASTPDKLLLALERWGL